MLKAEITKYVEGVKFVGFSPAYVFNYMYSKADGSFDTVTDDALLIVTAFYERGNNFANIIEKTWLVNDTTKKLSALVTKYDIEIKAGRGKQYGG